MPRPDERQFLNEVLQGCAPAVEFCEQLFRISQLLDDLIDKDKPVSDATITRAFWVALIELPANPFYRQHELYLRPLMASALQDWTDATSMERAGDQHGKHLAFVLRDQLTAVVIQCAYLIGGYGWMQEVSEHIRRHFHEDTLVDYMNDLRG